MCDFKDWKKKYRGKIWIGKNLNTKVKSNVHKIKMDFKKKTWPHYVNPSYSMHSTWISRGVTGRSIQNSCYLIVYLSKCVESLTESVFRKLLLLRYILVFLNLPCSYILLNRQGQHQATYLGPLFWKFLETKLYQKSLLLKGNPVVI